MMDVVEHVYDHVIPFKPFPIFQMQRSGTALLALAEDCYCNAIASREYTCEAGGQYLGEQSSRSPREVCDQERRIFANATERDEL